MLDVLVKTVQKLQIMASSFRMFFSLSGVRMRPVADHLTQGGLGLCQGQISVLVILVSWALILRTELFRDFSSASGRSSSPQS